MGNKILNSTRNKVLDEIINNPNVTRSELANNCNLTDNYIYKTLTFLKKRKIHQKSWFEENRLLESFKIQMITFFLLNC